MCLCAICVIMVAAFLLNIYDTHRSSENEAAIEANHQAMLVSAQVSRDLGALERALNVLAARIENDGLDFFRKAEGALLIEDMARAAPLDTIFWVFHPNGVALATSIDTKGGEVKISDRDYYKKVVQSPTIDLVIGAPVTGKVSKSIILPIARSVRSPKGELVALVSTSLRLSSVNEAYRSFLGSGDNTIELKRADTGETIFRIDALAGRASADQPSPSGAGDRMAVSERIQGYPLVATATVHTGPWRERWRREALLQSAWLTVGLFLSCLLYWTVIREARILDKNAVLLTEVHHRVKNNLAIIQSLLVLEANRAPPESRRGYNDSVARIEAMGLVHHLIYDHQQFEGIALDHYLPRLCAAICGAATNMHAAIDADPIEVPLDTAVPLALIMNEVITNSLKHAPTPGKEGKIVVTLRSRSKDVMLSIQDNGPGLPDNVLKGNSASLGLQIVRELTRQISGTCWLDNADGAHFTLLFTPPPLNKGARGQA